MNEYNFILYFQLETGSPEDHLDALFEAGCSDATIGTGLPGSIALDFSREAQSAKIAITLAIQNVQQAIPTAILTEIGPDLVNTTETAEILSEKVQTFSRQVIRKYSMNQVVKTQTRFPAPMANSSSRLWHLTDVLYWLTENNKIDSNNSDQIQNLITTTLEARAINTEIQQEQLKAIKQRIVA